MKNKKELLKNKNIVKKNYKKPTIVNIGTINSITKGGAGFPDFDSGFVNLVS